MSSGGELKRASQVTVLRQHSFLCFRWTEPYTFHGVLWKLSGDWLFIYKEDSRQWWVFPARAITAFTVHDPAGGVK